MTIFTSPKPLVWGELDVPMLGLDKDWFGAPVVPAAAFSVAMDPQRLWFVAHHRAPASIHPQARPGRFLPGLWHHDVAELFLSDSSSGRYFEFNLAPNGAWWSCEFTAPRVRADASEVAMPEVATFADLSADGSWLVAMAIPLDLLRARLDFGTATHANVTMVIGSPKQRFLTAADLAGDVPDFHQPSGFPKVGFIPLGELPIISQPSV